MRSSPQGQSVFQRHGGEAVFLEDVDVGGPADRAIRAARREPIVVAGGDVDRERDIRQGGTQELQGIGPNTIELEDVARREDGVAALLAGELQDPGQRQASVPPPQPCRLR